MIAKRILILTISSMLAAGSALAQPAPAPAPARPFPPSPPAPQAPPAPVLNLDIPFDFDIQFGQPIQDQLAQVGIKADQIRVQADQFRAQAENFQFAGRGPRSVFAGTGPRRGDDGLYSAGQRALDRGQWDEALADFNRVVSNAGPRAEGAVYWKAYTLNKLGRRDEARAAIADLRKTYPMSRWLDDANALDMEIQQAAGRSVSPENQPDEELKLMALNALVRSDPDRAFPLLDNLLKTAQTPRLKERVLFVLSQTDSPRAQQTLEQVARGGGNPDLQVTAITYLGALSRRKGNSQPLYDIYAATSDVNVKRALLQALRSAGDTDHIMQP